MKTVLALVFISLSACGALAQQYRNFEAQPDRRGGVQGTWGNRNFEIDNYKYGNKRGNPSGHVGGRRAGSLSEKPSVTPGNTGATQSRCYVDGDGRSVCR